LVWANGQLIYGTPIESIDSLAYSEMEDIDTLHLFLPRLQIKNVHKTVYVHDTFYIYTKNGHEYVDLGLSVKWATCNVGAESPEDFGDYFAWGETTTKENYSWSTYKYHDNVNSTIYPYSGVVLNQEDDAATVIWGEHWRTPTYDEFNELKTQCTWTKTTINGVDGFLVTSNVEGYTDKSIFLPKAGEMYDSTHGYSIYGRYWSSSLHGNDLYAYFMTFSSSAILDYNLRCQGCSVRPVCK
jgi:hypothetical protein